MIDDPEFDRIAAYAASLSLLTPELQRRLREEHRNAAASFAELSEGAQYAWNRARSVLSGEYYFRPS